MLLDVGCGSQPKGDVNCDLLLEHHDLREKPKTILNFVKCSAEFLPFISKSFEEVYCSHLLEHLEDYSQALQELKRVAAHRVTVILPFALFSVFDIFVHRFKFGSHIRWLRQYHKHFFLINPLKEGSCKPCFLNLMEAVLHKKKVFSGWLRIPIPFETRTVINL